MLSNQKRILVVGDPHATPDSLEECGRLIDLICESAHRTKAWSVVFLGDLFDTHGVVHLSVLEFWEKAFQRIPINVFCLVGNHDMAGTNQDRFSALHMLESETVTIVKDVDYDPELELGFVSYFPTQEQFEGALEKLPPYTSTVFCHQTFSGSRMDNGFYAKDGFDTERLPKHIHFVSGHIHTPQDFGNFTYLGAPRWRRSTDANKERYIYCYDVVGGHLILHEKIPTKTHCRAMYRFSEKPGEELHGLEQEVRSGKYSEAHVYVDIHGPRDWVFGRKTVWSALDVRYKSIIENETRAPEVVESRGVDTAFLDYTESYVPPRGTPKPDLKERASSLVQRS